MMHKNWVIEITL